ncbi:Clp protease N-terminal domain-containing protein [Amycolatopsis suaedae]|uniref:Clp protease n=1 Tax=Amycolatopsis suaedae TaxID=2510978 RepID=A0A4Q7J071_9PSEU|nr:Clp protease N-terminal domain-containing protein [Amycolatopsis suaedae]RZQ60108.1 Clp protease [Amycolatopsis suaedae]
MSAIDHYINDMLVRAEREAVDGGSGTIEAEHLLLALAGEGGPVIREALASTGLDHASILAALEREFDKSLAAVGVSRAAFDLPRPTPRPGKPKLGASTKLALERGFALVPRKKDLRPVHLLLGVLAAEAGTVPRALEVAEVDVPALRVRLRESLHSS